MNASRKEIERKENLFVVMSIQLVDERNDFVPQDISFLFSYLERLE